MNNQTKKKTNEQSNKQHYDKHQTTTKTTNHQNPQTTNKHQTTNETTKQTTNINNKPFVCLGYM